MSADTLVKWCPSSSAPTWLLSSLPPPEETSPPTSGKPNSRAGKTKNSMVGVVSANTQMVGVVQFFRGKMNDESVNCKSWYGIVSTCELLVILAAWKMCQFHPTKKTTQTQKQTNSKERVEDVWFISSPHPIQKKQTRPLKDKNERIIPKVSKPRASNHHFPGSRFLEFEYQSSANVLTTECD